MVAGRHHLKMGQSNCCQGNPHQGGCKLGWGVNNQASQPLGSQSTLFLRGAQRDGSQLPRVVTWSVFLPSQPHITILISWDHLPLILYVPTSFFRSASEGTQTKTLEMAISVESQGGAENNTGRFVLSKPWAPWCAPSSFSASSPWCLHHDPGFPKSLRRTSFWGPSFLVELGLCPPQMC